MNRILAAVALAFLLPGPVLAQDLQGTLQKIKASGTIAIGFREQSVPFSFLGTDGKPAGYSVDLCQRIVAGADAYASDRTILIGLAVTARDPGQFALADQYLSYEPYGLMVRRGDAPFRLGVNRVLSYLYRSGEIAQIYGRWFGKLGAPSSLLVAMYTLHALPE